MLGNLKKHFRIVLSIVFLATQFGCGPTTPSTKNDLWEVDIVSAQVKYLWHSIDRFAGSGLLVMELKFHRLDSPETTSISLSDISLLGFENYDKNILAISKADDSQIIINGADVSEIEFLYCEQQPFSDYGCSYSLSAEGGLPDAEHLTEISSLLKSPNPIIVLETAGDTLNVTLAFDDKGGNEDLIFTFDDLPPITFTAD